MRPEGLTLEGFTSFREATEVDFTDADLFALTGPTGAGKSSLIDAMTFALYGVVPRYDDQRLVGPVISKGAVEARVSFRFTVDGRSHTVVRVVRATKAGATTKEARLETADGEVLADDARGVTAAVESLLGLGFDHFTTCVVLPQGQFARFLQAERRTRQDLLVELLDLGIYESMAQAARQRAAAAGARVETVDTQLGDIPAGGPDEAAALERRVQHLDRLLERIEEAQPRLDQLDRDVAEREREATEAEQLGEVLGGIRVPDEVDALRDRLAMADEELAQLRTEADAATVLLERLEARRGELEDRDRLASWSRLHEQRAALLERVTKGEVVVADAEEVLAEAGAALAAERQAAAGAEADLEAARRHDRAADLVEALEVGAPCPVCRQTVHAVPEHEASASLAAATEERDRVVAARDAAERRRAEAAEARASATALLDRLREEVAGVDEDLEGAPPADEVTAALTRLDLLRTDLDNAARAERTAVKARDEGEARRKAIAARRADLRSGYDEARGAVAGLDPPSSTDDLAADWAALADWAAGQVDAVGARARAARAALGEAADERAAIAARIATTCEEMGIDVSTASPHVAVALARQSTETDLEALRTQQERRASLEEERSTAEADRQVADGLARHLSAGGFETWLLDEAVDRLVVAAGARLRELTRGAYSLTMDERGQGFEIVDHTSADARRPAKTLSGGETFLAALSLALALADQVADLAGPAAPRLESIFLDEGFGTLDLDTLDVVAGALEELGAGGRTVGVVTHVRELAERLPVRFEVRKGPHTATVERRE